MRNTWTERITSAFFSIFHENQKKKTKIRIIKIIKYVIILNIYFDIKQDEIFAVFIVYAFFVVVIFPFHVDKYFQLCDKHQPAEITKNNQQAIAN